MTPPIRAVRVWGRLADPQGHRLTAPDEDEFTLAIADPHGSGRGVGHHQRRPETGRELDQGHIVGPAELHQRVEFGRLAPLADRRHRLHPAARAGELELDQIVRGAAAPAPSPDGEGDR